MISALAAGRLRARLPQLADDVLPAVLIFVPLVLYAGPEAVFPGLLLCGPLAFRRRWPLPALVLALLGVLALGQVAPAASIVALVVAAYSAGTFSAGRNISLAVVAVVCLAIVWRYGNAVIETPPYTTPFLILVPAWLAGSAIRNWRLRADAMRERADLLAQEGEHAMRSAIVAERERIAREMHDVIAHSVSVMVVQTGAARQVMASDPDAAVNALLTVESTGREALGQLRGMLGLLHPESEGDMPLEPQPGLRELAPLIERVRAAGLPATLQTVGEARQLPPTLDLTAYRLIQEALTNAVKHTGHAATEVLLEYRDTELKIEVIDDGAGSTETSGSGSGRGLVGMRERVALHGGRVEAGPRPGRGYAVRAWLPYGLDAP